MSKIQCFMMLVLVFSVANVCGADFLDDFDRPDGEIGNGWETRADGTIEVKIVDNEVLISGEQATDWARSGISRAVGNETKISFDFKADDSLNVHIRIDDVASGAYIDVYAWPGGPFSYASSEDGGWPGWVPIEGSNMIPGEYNTLLLEQEGTEFAVTLNDVAVGTITNGNLTDIGSLLIASDAAAGTVGSLHIDNVILLEPEPLNPGIGNLVAYYALDGNTDDSSGNELHGTIVGDANYVDGPAGYGMAMEFYGDSYVDCNNDPILDINGPISISLWIRPDANDPEGQATTTAPLCKAMSGMSPSWSWQVRYGWNSPQPYMAFTFNTSPRAWAYVGQNLERYEWAHIACSHDGATLTCYLNGVETDSTPMGAITNSDTPVLIGSDGWRSDWIGAIDEVAIYDRGLSDREIRYLASDLTPVDPGIENLVAYYPLDNDANDVSGNGNNGVLAGDPNWVEGKIGAALEFDGIDDHVDCGNDPSLDITGPITIGAWVKPLGPGSSSYPRIVDKSNGTGGADPGYKLYLRSAQDYRISLSAGGEFVSSTISAVLDEWNYVAFVTDGAQRKLFLNGVWEVWDISSVANSSVNPLYLGDSPAGSRPLNGIVDEVTIYNRALSKPEVHFIAGEN